MFENWPDDLIYYTTFNNSWQGKQRYKNLNTLGAKRDEIKRIFHIFVSLSNRKQYKNTDFKSYCFLFTSTSSSRWQLNKFVEFTGGNWKIFQSLANLSFSERFYSKRS